MEYNQYKFSYIEEQYEKLTMLGENAVFLAKKKNTNRIVVLKYVSTDVLAIYEKLQKIAHPALAHIYDIASDGRRGIVIEEYISGRTLTEELETKGIFSEQQSIQMLEKLLDVLAIVHAQGIIHRDITPNNILISTDGVLKLIDFGIARERKENCIQDTTILGTAGFAAPEQFGFFQTDERADIYALGVLWNKMLTGKFPNEKRYKNREIAEIISKCTQMDANNRYATAHELQWELLRLQGMTVSARKKYAWKSIVPGFRTGVTWKYVVATIGYLCMLFSTVMFLGEIGKTPKAFLLESIAVLLYIWIATLLAANIFEWDQKLWPVRLLPKPAAVVVRVLVWMIIFYVGVSLENYVKSAILGIKTVTGT